MAINTVVQSLARSPYRVRLAFALPRASSAGIDVAANWSAARADGASGATPAVTYVVPVDGTTLELALSGPMPEGLALTFANATAVGNAATVTWLPPSADFVGGALADDPEAEAFGVDWDWLAPALDAKGDLPVLSGRRCLLRDLACIAVTEPGELFHRPTEGGGMRSKVNGVANTADALDEVARSLRTQWQRDERVRAADVTAAADSAGRVTATGSIATAALPEKLTVTSREG